MVRRTRLIVWQLAPANRSSHNLFLVPCDPPARSAAPFYFFFFFHPSPFFPYPFFVFILTLLFKNLHTNKKKFVSKHLASPGDVIWSSYLLSPFLASQPCLPLYPVFNSSLRYSIFCLNFIEINFASFFFHLPRCLCVHYYIYKYWRVLSCCKITK